MDKLLQKQTAVNTITISVDKGNGEIWLVHKTFFLIISLHKNVKSC